MKLKLERKLLFTLRCLLFQIQIWQDAGINNCSSALESVLQKLKI